MNKDRATRYRSTGGSQSIASFDDAILSGQAPDGGLYLPVDIPLLDPDRVTSFIGRPFMELAQYLSEIWLAEVFPVERIREIAEEVFTFEPQLVEITKGRYVLELFHGPTFSFKDFGARFLASTLAGVLAKRGVSATIITATSGDTGSAVAAACAGIENIRAIVLYPKGQISSIQEHQIAMERKGVSPIAVDGTFDDCQALVKRALADPELSGCNLTSSNSINIARLIAQSFYYIYLAINIPQDGGRTLVSVPSGNFGNLTAGLIAQRQGIKFEFCAATNINEVVPNFLKSGNYQPMQSKRTLSSAMDVGNPSNFARVRALFDDDLDAMRAAIFATSVDDGATLDTIKRIYESTGYILDPHAAVAWKGCDRFLKAHGEDNFKCVALATADPAKFPDVIERAIGVKPDMPNGLMEQSRAPIVSKNMGREYAEFKRVLLL